MWLLHASETFLSLVEGGWLLTTKQIFQRIKKQRIANTTFLLEPLVLTLKWMPPFGTTWWSRWSRSTLLAGWDLSWWGVKRSAGLCIVVVWLVRLKNPKTFKRVHLKQPELLLNVKKVDAGSIFTNILLGRVRLQTHLYLCFLVFWTSENRPFLCLLHFPWRKK